MKFFFPFFVLVLQLDFVLAAEFKTTKEVGCDSAKLKQNAKTISFGESGEKVGALAACAKVNKVGKRFSELNCQLSIECSKTKIDQSPASLRPIMFYVAEDYISIKLAEQIKKMENLDLLIRFVSNRYSQLGMVSCVSPLAFQKEKNDDCNSASMEEGFSRLTKSCNNSSNAYCFGATGLPLKDYKAPPVDAVVDASSSFQKAFTNQSVKRLDKIIAHDKDVLTDISDIMVGQENNDSKIFQIFLKLKDYKQQGILDPVLGSAEEHLDSFESFKTTSQYKHFVKLLKNKQWDKQSALVAIEIYRMKKTQEMLTQECAETSSYYSICAEAADVMASRNAGMGYDSRALGVLVDNDNDDRYEFLKQGYADGIQNLEDYKIIMDSQRCSKIFNKNKIELVNAETLNPNRFIFSNGPDGSDKKNSTSELSASEYAKGLDQFAQNQARFIMENSSTESIRGEAAPKNKLESMSAQPVKAVEPAVDASRDFVKDNNMSNNEFNDSKSIRPDGQSLNSYGMHPADNPEEVSPGTKRTVSNSNNQLNEKITELNKKIADSEGTFERMKVEKLEAAAEKERQQKKLENNKTIAELGRQISDLSSEAKKRNEKVEMAVDEGVRDSQGTGNAFVRSNSNSFEQESVSQNTSRSKNSSADMGPDVSHSYRPAALESGEGISQSAQSHHDSKTVFLTKLDGMSSEKISETISQKIIELEGQPFFIEEGGLVEEIVPVTKNGKVIIDKKGNPLFEKVIKGKVGDARFTRDKKAITKNVMTDAADLKRDQEEKLKRERIQYMKLKKITNDLLNKK